MRLAARWLVFFAIIGLYVVFLGGVFYYNLFKWTFDEKLKQDIIETVKIHYPTLKTGLLKAKYITMEEFDIMSSLKNDERVSSIIYLSRNGSIRWHKDARFIGKQFDEFQKTVAPPTDAIAQAYVSKVPKVRQVPKQPFYEIAIPFSVRGEIIGIVDLMVSRAGAEMLIGSAMRKYAFGAVGVLFLLGLPLYFFFHHYVISPLEALKDNVDTISMKNFDIRFTPRKDEVGELAGSFTRFLNKVKIEIDSIVNKDKKYKDAEQKWWRSLLGIIVPVEQHVIVVDENNNVLYANFELAGEVDSKNIHLLDVIDSQQQNLLRLVGQAFESPNQVIEGETVFKGDNLNVKILHVGEASEMNRTLILFYPKPSISI
ncbi:MAG: HAMP domain-containing protein [Elusimicrobia bacterium]|nr:HAMP domain-containing protein [Elusimicrobiota bacterium]